MREGSFNINGHTNTLKTKSKKPFFYRKKIFNNLLIFNMVPTKNIEWHTIIYEKQTFKIDQKWIKSRMLVAEMRL